MSEAEIPRLEIQLRKMLDAPRDSSVVVLSLLDAVRWPGTPKSVRSSSLGDTESIQ